jgi:hypothetical protein
VVVSHCGLRSELHRGDFASLVSESAGSGMRAFVSWLLADFGGRGSPFRGFAERSCQLCRFGDNRFDHQRRILRSRLVPVFQGVELRSSGANCGPSQTPAAHLRRLFTAANVRSVFVEFGPMYKGPVRWLVVTVWAFCVPSFLALVLVLLFYGLAIMARILSTDADAAGRFLSYVSVGIWFLAIPCAVVGLAGALGLLYYNVPAKTNWTAFAFAAASGIAIGLTYLLFAAM